MEQEMTNRERLQEAGVIKSGYNFTQSDIAAIDSLSHEEVNVLINVFNELGAEFLERNCPHGIVF